MRDKDEAATERVLPNSQVAGVTGGCGGGSNSRAERQDMEPAINQQGESEVKVVCR